MFASDYKDILKDGVITPMNISHSSTGLKIQSNSDTLTYIVKGKLRPYMPYSQFTLFKDNERYLPHMTGTGTSVYSVDVTGYTEITIETTNQSDSDIVFAYVYGER